MITKITIKNFKKIEFAEFELGRTVVFVGANNSGKTSALQAISLWELALRQASSTLNRYDIYAAPVPSVRQLWFSGKSFFFKKHLPEKDLDVENQTIEIVAEGFTDAKAWCLGFEFSYANSESINCRLIPTSSDISQSKLLEQVGFLPPLSGLAAKEDKLEIGSIRARIGEGRTADVLRNLCWLVAKQEDNWKQLTDLIYQLFKVQLDPPEYNELTGQLTVTYKEFNKQYSMDLANAGRGFQQILLLFAYVYFTKNTILLVDEPDSHLEILRQKDIYNRLSSLVKSQESQLIIATHSEAILNEAADTDTIVGFLGTPHIVNNKKQLVKALTSIGFEQYLLAAQTKLVIYLEGSTDLRMLIAWAKVLNHPALSYLTNNPFIKYVANNTSDARNHFYGLKEAIPDLKAIALYDRINNRLQSTNLKEIMWQRREIENYLPIPEVIERYIEKQNGDIALIRSLINDYMPPIAKKDKTESWWFDTKMSDDFLDKIFRKYFMKLKQPVSLMSKSNYYQLAELAKPEELDIEIQEKLDCFII